MNTSRIVGFYQSSELILINFGPAQACPNYGADAIAFATLAVQMCVFQRHLRSHQRQLRGTGKSCARAKWKKLLGGEIQYLPGNLARVERSVETPYSLDAGLSGEKCSPECLLPQANRGNDT